MSENAGFVIGGETLIREMTTEDRKLFEHGKPETVVIPKGHILLSFTVGNDQEEISYDLHSGEVTRVLKETTTQ